MCNVGIVSQMGSGRYKKTPPALPGAFFSSMYRFLNHPVAAAFSCMGLTTLPGTGLICSKSFLLIACLSMP